MLCAIFLTSPSVAQINLPDEVSAFGPIIAGCSCVVPDGAEITVRWTISSPEGKHATVLPLDNKAYIWGEPGRHQLTASVVWLHFEVIEVKLADGTTKTIKNLLAWDSEVFDHRFTIIGQDPLPPPPPPPPTPDDNHAPVAMLTSAPPKPTPGNVVELDGSQSSDPDGDQLSYQWVLIQPNGSTAHLANDHAQQTSFLADKPGIYSVRLEASDGMLSAFTSSSISVTDVPSGPRWVILLEETEDRTPQLADLEVDLRELHRAKSKLWIEDVDTPSSWVPDYERKRQQLGLELPCMFIVDQQTHEIVWSGAAPESVSEYERLMERYGG